MNAKTILTTLALALPLSFAAPAGALDLLDWNAMPWDLIHCSENPEEVADMFHVFPDPTNPELSVAVHTYCYKEFVLDSDRGTDCPSHAFTDNGYYWTTAFSFQIDASNSGLSSSGVLSATDTYGNTWDTETAANIYGASTLGGSASNVGRQDFVNQLGWKRLAAGTIAQTTTWYYTSTGEAVESDAAYNTRFSWSLTGEANKMDYQAIGTHEIGHTFGLGHPATNTQNECLTMYAYADYGQTHQRTLGDGDIIGLEAIYGA